MWKALVAGAAAIAIAGSSLVYAQQRPSDPASEKTQNVVPRFRMTAEDAQAFADARVAALKAGLKLTAEQEKNWPPVEAAIRDLAKQRYDRISARRDAPRDRDPIDRLRQRADAMSAAAAGLKRLADAADPLYKSLDDNQKRRALVLARGAVRPGPGHAHRWQRSN